MEAERLHLPGGALQAQTSFVFAEGGKLGAAPLYCLVKAVEQQGVILGLLQQPIARAPVLGQVPPLVNVRRNQQGYRDPLAVKPFDERDDIIQSVIKNGGNGDENTTGHMGYSPTSGTALLFASVHAYSKAVCFHLA